MAKLSVELNRYFFEEDRDVKVTLEDILSLAEERIFGFLFVILALPSALPIPAPGYSVPFGVAMFLLAFQLVLGHQTPWLPTKMMKGSMKLETVQGIVKKGIPWLRRVETLTKPRFAYICTSLPGRILLGSVISLLSISMMIPLPLTNTIPAMGIFVIGFSLFEDDGLITILGLFIGSLGLTITTTIMVALYHLGFEAVSNFGLSDVIQRISW